VAINNLVTGVQQTIKRDEVGQWLTLGKISDGIVNKQ
jgi:hypothetical protein